MSPALTRWTLWLSMKPMQKMIADYMETGFLDNIIEMFRQDKDLYTHIPALMSDERGRVRLGTVALVESLMEEDGAEITAVIPAVAAILGHQSPTVRADAVYLLGIIGHRDALPFLRNALQAEVEPVRELIMETIKELSED